MEKVLYAVMTAHTLRDRANSIRDTWAPEVPQEQADVRFVLGRGKTSPGDDEIHLDVPDGYHYLSAKVQLLRRWALSNGYTRVVKIDDDCYLRPERMGLMSDGDYVGRLRAASGNYIAPYCSGFCYSLSEKALKVLADVEWRADDDFSEDRWTGGVLLRNGIGPINESRFIVEYSKASSISGREPPLAGNDVIASCEYTPDLMRRVHAQFKSGKRSEMTAYARPGGSLSRVAIMIKTFMRDGFLRKCIEGLEQNFADCQFVIVEDGKESTNNDPWKKITKRAELRAQKHDWLILPYDSGFGAKANAAIPHLLRKEYALIGSDDFDFSDPNVRPGVEAMQKVLDAVPSLGMVSGRVDNNPYEFCWEPFERGLREVPGYHGSGEMDGTRYHLTDLTVNYSMIRTKLFEPAHGNLRWDGGSVKIGGGEHSAFFIDVQRSYWSVAYVEGANINQMKPFVGYQHKEYPALRARARQAGRPCLKARGIDTYVLGDGTVEVS